MCFNTHMGLMQLTSCLISATAPLSPPKTPNEVCFDGNDVSSVACTLLRVWWAHVGRSVLGLYLCHLKYHVYSLTLDSHTHTHTHTHTHHSTNTHHTQHTQTHNHAALIIRCASVWPGPQMPFVSTLPSNASTKSE